MIAQHAPREDLDVAALTVAMIVAPGVYARNRMFSFFAAPVAARARTRARLVRSLVAQIGRAKGAVADLVLEGVGPGHSLHFKIPRMAFTRTLVLTPEELAALRFVLSRPTHGQEVLAPHPALAATETDRALVESVLKKLA